eukprot:COSAG05_NODE_61_length_23137_cov_22.080693_10_plen_104_part_00
MYIAHHQLCRQISVMHGLFLIAINDDSFIHAARFRIVRQQGEKVDSQGEGGVGGLFVHPAMLVVYDHWCHSYCAEESDPGLETYVPFSLGGGSRFVTNHSIKN